MREIKFRYVFKHKIFTDISICYFTLKQIEEGIVGKTLESGMTKNGYEIIAKNLYTHSKDKNNKEVYKGDIVKYERQGNEFVIGYIEYRHCRYVINLNDGYYDLGGTKEFIEIIDNIYENRELLKKKNTGRKNDLWQKN